MASQSKGSAVAVNVPPRFLRLLDQMAIEATEESEEFGSPTVTSMLKILEAESESEMWDSDELTQTGGRDLKDVEQTILAYAVKFSARGDIQSPFRDRESGRQMYLLIRSARISDGEEFVWNTSAPLLVGKIFWLANHEKLPAECVIRATDLGAGQALLKLKPIPKRAAQGQPPF